VDPVPAGGKRGLDQDQDPSGKKRQNLGEASNPLDAFYMAYGADAQDGGGRRVLIDVDEDGRLYGTLVEVHNSQYTLVSRERETGDIADLRDKVRRSVHVCCCMWTLKAYVCPSLSVADGSVAHLLHVPQFPLVYGSIVSIPKDCEDHLDSLCKAQMIAGVVPPQPATGWGAPDTMLYELTYDGADVIRVFANDPDAIGPSELICSQMQPR